MSAPAQDAEPEGPAAVDAALARLEQALDHLAASATATRAMLDQVPAVPDGAPPGASRAEIAALADRLEQTLARLRAAAEADAREPQGD